MTAQKTPAQKKKYNPPCVHSYGDIREMTHATGKHTFTVDDCSLKRTG
jgi:hypothetical protein